MLYLHPIVLREATAVQWEILVVHQTAHLRTLHLQKTVLRLVVPYLIVEQLRSIIVFYGTIVLQTFLSPEIKSTIPLESSRSITHVTPMGIKMCTMKPLSLPPTTTLRTIHLSLTMPMMISD